MTVSGSGLPAAAPAARTMHLRVLSPARAAYDGQALSVILPAFDGEWGVLANHAPMVAALATGCLRLTRPDGGSESFAIRGGFAEVRDNTVTVLSPDCRGAAELSPESIAAELGAAAPASAAPADKAAAASRQAWAKACRTVLSASAGKHQA